MQTRHNHFTLSIKADIYLYLHIETLSVMKTYSLIATIVLTAISLSSCKCNKSKDTAGGVPTPENQTSSALTDSTNASNNPESTVTSSISEDYEMDVEKIFSLIKEVSSDWKDDDGLKGQKAGLDLLKHTSTLDGEIELIAFYYGHNVRLVADSPDKFTSPNAMNAPVFTPNGSNSFYLLIGADASSGAIIFFNDRKDYDDFIVKVREYGLYKDNYGSSFIPATKTGKVQNIPANNKNFYKQLFMSFEPMGLKDGWQKIIMGLDI